MNAPDGLLPLIRVDGAPFGTVEIAKLTEGLSALSPDERVSARNSNAGNIATHAATRMLVVSGPGTGKSTLFKGRLVHWLKAYPTQRVAVATFVRKLVRDLNEDIASDASITDKSRVSVMTLHSLARSIVEKNRGSQDLRLRRHCLVVSRMWEEMVWQDAVSLHDDLRASDYPWSTVLEALYDGESPTEANWAALRNSHLRLEQFYNALTFPDLILSATQAVVENVELVEDTLFIIDEFQDFNLAEDALIRELTNGSPGVLLAGDDDQVLYDRLRRAHPSIIRGYYRDASFVNAMLPFCGRCSTHVCGAAEAFLAAGRPPESITKVFLPLSETPDDKLVAVIASSTPKAGVQYIERFLEAHRDAIEQRQEEIRAGSKKDAYVLILTPAREMNFLKAGNALAKLRDVLSKYAPEDERPGPDYWRLRDYYYAGNDTSQNYSIRKVFAYEQLDRDVVASLLREALDRGVNLADLKHDTVKACLKKCAAIHDILEDSQTTRRSAELVEALGDVTDPDSLARDLERLPLGSTVDPDTESLDLEQKEVVGAVDITTIVGAKGLSADHVVVLGCDDVNLAKISRSAFFVALTRARASLTLIACPGGGGAKALHDFVLTLPDNHTQAFFAKAAGVQAYATIAGLQDHLEKIQYAKAMAAKNKVKKV